MPSEPRRCTRWAPLCLASPIEAILARPLAIAPRKSVCGLTRLMRNARPASTTLRSISTGKPSSSPIVTVSMVARIGAPIASSVTP